MFPNRIQHLPCLAVLGSCLAFVTHAQTQLSLVNEIKLPVHHHLGTLGGGWPAFGSTSGELFQFKVSRDQSLLILYPNTSNRWPLFRVRKWWTSAPEIQELDLPGWTEANARYETDIGTDMLVTQDGKYAIAMGSVGSVKDARHIPFPPSQSIEHKPDLLITLVDLERWQIVGALHTATIDPYAEFRGAAIVNGKWIALQGLDAEPESVKFEHLYDRVNRLISIPDLKPGPGCPTTDPAILELALGKPPGGAAGLSGRNDASCRDLLADASVASMRIVDWLIYLGHDPEPENLNAHSQMLNTAGNLEKEAVRFSTDLNWPHDEYNLGHWTSNEWHIYIDNPPFESPAGIWYQLQGQDKGVNFHYQLKKYTQAGRLLKERDADLKTGPGCLRYGCVCNVVDAAEQRNAVLALCRAVSLNWVDGEDWHNQWVAAFRADDLSPIGDAEVKTNHTRAAIAIAEGRTYVAAVDEGKVVRIYSLPVR